MACKVDVTVKGDVKEILEDVKKLAKKEGITFKGDEKKGSFEGKGIKGNYTVSGKKISITVTDKPWYAPCSAIEKAIKDWFKGK